MKKVLIVVPTTNQQVSSEIASLFGLAQGRNFIQNKYHFSTSIMEGVRPVAAARNAIAKFFLESDHDVLWMIDQDIVPVPDVFKLLDVDAEIVAPIMPTYLSVVDYRTDTFRFEFPICAVRYKDFSDMRTRYTPDISNGGVIEVDGVGFGCTLIRREVLEDRRLWADTKFTKLDGVEYDIADMETSPPIFQSRTMPNGVLETGEDYDFCYRAKKLGYKVALHSDVAVGHIRQVDLLRMMSIREMLDLRKEPLKRKAI